MTAHSNLEKKAMLYAQKEYKGIKIWRFDNGQAYAKFSVKKCLEEYKKTKSITMAMKKLIVITYGNPGFPDLAGVYCGVFFGIEIKVGADRQSKEQKATQKAIESAGGLYMLLDDKSPIEGQLAPLDKVRAWKEGN